MMQMIQILRQVFTVFGMFSTTLFYNKSCILWLIKPFSDSVAVSQKKKCVIKIRFLALSLVFLIHLLKTWLIKNSTYKKICLLLSQMIILHKIADIANIMAVAGNYDWFREVVTSCKAILSLILTEIEFSHLNLC